MKKSVFLVMAAIGIGALPFAGCGSSETGGSKPAETGTGTYYGIESTEAVYGVAAVTAAKLLAASEAPAAALAAAEGNASASVSSEAETFNKYFNMLDSFLDKGETKTVVADNSSEDPAVQDFEYLLTITGKDADGASVTHTVYFSETKGEPSVTTHRDDDETTTVESVTYTLTGAVEMGKDADGAAVYYLMSGTRTERTVTEEEGGEKEVERIGELKMRAYSDSQHTADYVELNHTMTSEEEEGESESESLYTYSVFVGGRLTEQTQIEFETESEHGETETEYSLRFLSGGVRGSYEIERKLVGGRTVIEVEYSLDGGRGSFTIEKNGENYRYRFSDGTNRELMNF